MAADKAHKAAIKAMRRAKARGDYRHHGQASSSIRKTALASPLAEHIGILSKADQALLEAYYAGDCTLKELAEENGVSRRTIARRIQSARCQVQASLEAEGLSKAQPTKGGVVDAQLAKELTAASERLEAAMAEVGTTVKQGAKLVTKPATRRDLLWGRGIYARAATAHAD